MRSPCCLCACVLVLETSSPKEGAVGTHEERRLDVVETEIRSVETSTTLR
jgi:hypothetical protein